MRMKHALGIMALLYFCFALKMRHVYAQDNKTPMFRDDFEYDVSRNARNAEVTFRAHGWTDAKANNTYFQRGAGYLYTQYDPLLKSRVLVMESLPSRAPIPEGWRYAQTDYWLKYGGEEKPLTTIPANVWFQFWTYATPESRFDRLKFLYPSRGVYPASRRDGRTDYMWLLSFQGRDHTGKEGPPGSRFLAFEAWHAERGDTPHDPSQRQRLFQNLAPRTPLLAGRWYQVRIHIDVSEEQGVYEAWVREKDGPWSKVAQWKGAVTRDFLWPIPAEERVGLRVLAMPTTVNAVDSKMYLDEFVMASSERDLP